MPRANKPSWPKAKDSWDQIFSTKLFPIKKFCSFPVIKNAIDQMNIFDTEEKKRIKIDLLALITEYYLRKMLINLKPTPAESLRVLLPLQNKMNEVLQTLDDIDSYTLLEEIKITKHQRTMLDRLQNKIIKSIEKLRGMKRRGRKSKDTKADQKAIQNLIDGLAYIYDSFKTKNSCSIDTFIDTILISMRIAHQMIHK